MIDGRGARRSPAISHAPQGSLERFGPADFSLWHPGCGFCSRMLPDLRRWDADPPVGAPQLVLVSGGTVEANWAMDLRAPVLLDEAFAVGRAFGAAGTPSALLLDARGNVASSLAIGADQVFALLTVGPADGAGQTGSNQEDTADQVADLASQPAA